MRWRGRRWVNLYLNRMVRGSARRGLRSLLRSRLIDLLGLLLGRRAGDLTLKIVLRLGEFSHCLAHAARQFWELLRTEEDQNDEENNERVGSQQVTERRDGGFK